MFRYKLRHKLKVFSLLLIAGCTTPTETPKQTPQRVDRPSRSVNTLLIRAEKSNDVSATKIFLEAATLALAQGNTDLTQQILDRIADPHISSSVSAEYLILSAKTAIANDQPEAAISFINDRRLQTAELTKDYQIVIGTVRSDAYRLNRSFIASARERIYLDSLLDEKTKLQNHEQIFSTLLKVPGRSLTSQAQKAITSDLRGWLSLAALTRQYQDDPLRQLAELNNWRKLWSHHPAASQLPRSLHMLSRIVSQQPSMIGLILPLQGDLGPGGRAIRDGFLAAHYEQEAQSTIVVYDSSKDDPGELVRLATSDGVELIIGPLSKEAVTSVTSLVLDIPVLALNRTRDDSLNPNLYQFGLAPEDEIRQVVEQVQAEGMKQALVIYPEGDWGLRNYQAFQDNWSAVGGTIVDSATFSNQRDYSELVKRLLAVDQSERRASEVRNIIGERLEFTPRRRQDIDFIFLLANPSQARGINPTLEHFYAEDIPVYATSHVYEYSDSWIDSIDLEGIRFCDIPWKLASVGQIQNKIQSTWSAARGPLARFYAQGLDAYRLYPRLQQLKELPDERLFGATGVLRLNRRNVIERELMWAQFKNGAPIATPIVVK